MGYTHNFSIATKELPKEKFSIFSNDVNKIFEFAKKNNISLVNNKCGGNDYPIANDEEICFNGVEGEGCEDMVISRFPKPDFCKTARLPYDKIVTAVLVAFKHHFPKAEISSDGGIDGFKEGNEICLELFGYEL